MEEEHYLLFQPLIPTAITTTTTTVATAVTTTTAAATGSHIKFVSSNARIFVRLLFIIFIGTLSIWANHEASKGFTITIINEAAESPSGKRFSLFYLCNGKATRILLSTSTFVEKLLYPNNAHPKKRVNHVTLRLSSRNLTHPALVESRKNHEYVIHLSPSVMEETNFNQAMLTALRRGVARLWLWDGHDSAPPGLINGMVEYITSLAGSRPVLDSGRAKESAVARFLNYCERQKPGFIGRLNRGMEREWHDQTVDLQTCYY
ncbi:hypothetical protein RJ639_028529 [Escallonia herrerae]|uniref:Uncharacterized protein n=1 Tax=Escallonia herrerae TaxID=1293975 RepID=A0AA88X377_9ASTE|nr:hypothetical protein RJ639_028529 [Escallonia herrerae]